MGVLKCSTLSLALSFLAGCSPGPRTDPQPPPAAPPAKTVFDPLTQQMERARDVQKTVDEQADAARKQSDSQERGDSPQ